MSGLQGNESVEDRIERIRQEHKELYDRVLKEYGLLKKNKKALESFEKETDKLLEDMSNVSAQVTSIEDYTWLTDAVIKWRIAFSSFLNRPRNIRLAPRPEQLAPPQFTKLFSEKDINTWISERARELSRLRKVSSLLRAAEEAIEKIPSTREEMDMDWRNANLDFASQVVEGHINFANQITAKSYSRLEKQWLREIKQMKAYFIWESGQGGGTPESDYLLACESIRQILVSREIKASQSDFKEAKAYLESRYLTDGKIDQSKSGTRALIKAKSSRVWEVTDKDDPEKDNLNAQKYVTAFYENIIPAAMNSDAEKTLIVLKAFQYSRSPVNRLLLINCFEVALAVYFLDPDTIEGFWRDANGKPTPASWTISTATVQSWPKDLIVPKEFEDKFQFDSTNKQIIFEGVMTQAQKDLFLNQLIDQEHINAIEELFEQSRLLPQGMTL